MLLFCKKIPAIAIKIFFWKDFVLIQSKNMLSLAEILIYLLAIPIFLKRDRMTPKMGNYTQI